MEKYKFTRDDMKLYPLITWARIEARKNKSNITVNYNGIRISTNGYENIRGLIGTYLDDLYYGFNISETKKQLLIDNIMRKN